MGKGGGSSTTTASIPAELKPLYRQTGQNLRSLQDENPVSSYLGANPTRIADLSGTQRSSLGLLNQNLSSAMGPLEEAPIVQAGHRYFTGTIAPGIENRASLSGLGRSTALTNALSAAEAQTLLPMFQQEQARRDLMIEAGMRAGDAERAVEQQRYNAEAQDELRRQAIAEQALFGPMGQLPSTFGRHTSTDSGGGLFK